MRILVTGARGKIGSATIHRLSLAGHDITAVDLAPGVNERGREVPYVRADLTDAGQAAAVVPGHEVVVHAAALASPFQSPQHVVFAQNLLATYHVLEAAERSGVRRVVNLSSEAATGITYATRPFPAHYVPLDEEHPAKPQDAYSLSKHLGEQLMDAAVARSDLTAISLRPTWVQWEGNVERNLGPVVRAHGEDRDPLFWTYLMVHDLVDLIALAATADLPGHEVFYAAGPDNAAGRPLHDLVRRHYGDEIELRPVERPDASGISWAKATQLLGWWPTRSWRDFLDTDGRLLPAVAQRLAAGETGVQRGLYAIS
jgi:nucleoside-diphosphate-sugar epimerase